MTCALCPRCTFFRPACLVLLAAIAFPTTNLESAEPAAGRDLIRLENPKPGTPDWQFHGLPAPLPGLEVVAEGFALHGGTRPVPYQATVHPTANGGFVFNASTIFWSTGLSAPPGHMPLWSHNTRPNGPDPRVQQITHNLLRRAIER